MLTKQEAEALVTACGGLVVHEPQNLPAWWPMGIEMIEAEDDDDENELIYLATIATKVEAGRCQPCPDAELIFEACLQRYCMYFRDTNNHRCFFCQAEVGLSSDPEPRKMSFWVTTSGGGHVAGACAIDTSRILGLLGLIKMLRERGIKNSRDVGVPALEAVV